jgi:hypothetical protein
LNVAVRWRVLVTNPAVLVDAPQARPHEVVPLSAAEARRLIQAAQQNRIQARWLTMNTAATSPKGLSRSR